MTGVVFAVRAWVARRLGTDDPDEAARAFEATYLGDRFALDPFPLAEAEENRFDVVFTEVLRHTWDRLGLPGAPVLTRLGGPVLNEDGTVLTIHRVRHAGAEWHFARLWAPWPDAVTMEMSLERDVERIRVTVGGTLGILDGCLA